jgi:hypothetical protein
MATPTERNWTAHLVISSDHAGLRPYFKRLEAELYHVLACVDHPAAVKLYIEHLVAESRNWNRRHQFLRAGK